jgi:exoribonuclease-2
LLKAAIAGSSLPYENDELQALAKHCTEQEDATKKSNDRWGNPRRRCCWNQGSASGFAGMDVGDRVSVQLVRTDVERGYIDFKRAG